VTGPLRESPESELVAVASRTQQRADEYAREHGIPRPHGSYDALLADPDVEAVYISVPNGPHVEWSIRALEAGKHVLCEKPFARYPDDVERAFAVAEAAERLLMEAFMWRHLPQTRQLVGLVADGAIGELRLLRASFSFTIAPSDVRLDPELAGGALMDVGSYCVSGLRLLAGEPVHATAHQVVGPTGVDLRLAATLSFADAVLGQMDCAFDLPYQQRLEVVGSDGSLSVRTPWNGRDPGIELRRGDDLEHVAVERADPYRLQCDNFSRAIRGREAPLLGRADALGQARTIDWLYRSAREGDTLARL
jgi:predicted dehydrogenase